jgi:hypothetical protein
MDGIATDALMRPAARENEAVVTNQFISIFTFVV